MSENIFWFLVAMVSFISVFGFAVVCHEGVSITVRRGKKS